MFKWREVLVPSYGGDGEERSCSAIPLNRIVQARQSTLELVGVCRWKLLRSSCLR